MLCNSDFIGKLPAGQTWDGEEGVEFACKKQTGAAGSWTEGDYFSGNTTLSDGVLAIVCQHYFGVQDSDGIGTGRESIRVYFQISDETSTTPAKGEKYLELQAGSNEVKGTDGSVFKLSNPVIAVKTSKKGFPVHQIPEGTVVTLYNPDGTLADYIVMEEYVDEEPEAGWPAENPFTFKTASDNLVSMTVSNTSSSEHFYLFVQVVKGTNVPDKPADPKPTTPADPAIKVEDIPASGTAIASNQTVTVDGKKVEFQMYALKDANGNLTNYIKLRDMAYVLNGTKAQFAVGYDGTISLTTGQPYEAGGTEMTTPYSGDRAYSGGAQTVKINGKDVAMTAITLTDDNGGGYNYFKLRDLGKALGFNVGYSNENGVFIESDKPYAE